MREQQFLHILRAIITVQPDSRPRATSDKFCNIKKKKKKKKTHKKVLNINIEFKYGGVVNQMMINL